ncbi:unnamed protein product [Closterium sp. NIES-54]
MTCRQALVHHPLFPLLPLLPSPPPFPLSSPAPFHPSIPPSLPPIPSACSLPHLRILCHGIGLVQNDHLERWAGVAAGSKG